MAAVENVQSTVEGTEEETECEIITIDDVGECVIIDDETEKEQAPPQQHIIPQETQKKDIKEVIEELCASHEQSSVEIHVETVPEDDDGNDGMYKCEVCFKPFRSRQFLFIHSRQHKEAEKRRMKCDYCDATFLWQEQFDEHLKTHPHVSRSISGTLIFQCPFECDEKFESPTDLEEHVFDRHLQSSSPFYCGLCNGQFMTLGRLKRHVKKMHLAQFIQPSIIPRHQCNHCPNSYTKKRDLTVHLATHVEVLPECNICPRKFQCQTALKIHMASHTRVKQYKCKNCDRSFRQERGLRSHEMHHCRGILSAKFPCNQCEKTLISEAALKRHMKKHAVGGDLEYFDDDDQDLVIDESV